ncbi:MAG: DPP IV N-terminal domain-containing protein, partial [Bacteroidota bacterium]
MKKNFIYCTILLLSTYCSLFTQKQITLKDIWQNGTFSVKKIHDLRSMKDGEHYTVLNSSEKGDAIIMYEYKSGKAIDTILKNDWLVLPTKKIEIEDYSFSSDENKILISSESERVYRHSTRENYYIWNREIRKITALSSGEKQMYAEFSPDGNKICFVRDNNIFIYDIASEKETQITTDGKINNIINGMTDWVYEEEFSFGKAWFWSPDGS